jgi:tetratricopeptide (TPR) repeat protein
MHQQHQHQYMTYTEALSSASSFIETTDSRNEHEESIKRTFAAKHKNLGNEAMTCKKYVNAITQYSKAIKILPYGDFSFYSNRCFAQLKMKLNIERALVDAQIAIYLLQVNRNNKEDCNEIKSNENLFKMMKCCNLKSLCLFELGRYTSTITMCNEMIEAIGKIQQKSNDNKELKKWNSVFQTLLTSSVNRKTEFDHFTVNGTQLRNFVQEFEECDELIEIIFSYCDAHELLQCRSVCQIWKSIVSHNLFWKRLCEKRWNGKQTINFKSVDRAVNTDQDSNLWKNLYWRAEKNAKRTCVTDEELAKINWKFYMGRHQTPMEAKFYQDHTFLSSMGMAMKWRLLEFGYRIQVEEYPQLTISRGSDWSYILTNDYVRFESTSFDADWPLS